MLIFLDFDGVLRRAQSERYRLEPQLVANFERLLRAMPEARVVITSSWREAFSMKEIRRLFSDDIQDHILGATPSASSRDGHYRHREVLGYLRAHGGENQPWVAVDDDPEHYPASAPVVITDAASGFDQDAARRLVALIAAREQGPS